MSKAFFINGGVGRVLCSIPGLEHYFLNNKDDSIVVAESWSELFVTSDILRDRVYPAHHRNLFSDKIISREIVSPEPYRLKEYYNQKCNLIQAFDMLVNGLKEVPETKPFNLSIGKADQVFGYNFLMNVKVQLKKDKVIVFQPFGSTAKLDGNFITDDSGRSFEVRDLMRLVEELGKDYAIVLMSGFKIPTDKPMPAVIPENVNLLQWMGIFKAADYFIGCDSVGQHYANALHKPATVVIGSTFPENISYPQNPNFKIFDIGLGKRTYSPLRISQDLFMERSNEDLMILPDEVFKDILKQVRTTLGKNKFQEQVKKALSYNESCCEPQKS
jgi:ADP-heptose:LPS heptosyltransferase